MKVWRGAGAILLLLLAACTTLSLDSAARLRALDLATDDVANIVLAFDVPLTLEPASEGSFLSVDIATPASGERHIKAMLVRADAGDVIGRLPPPAAHRTYYLFAVTETDKTKLRETQAWARTLPPGNNALAISLAPRFCRTGDIDPAETRVSVLVALPGTTGLAPLVNSQSVKALLASSGATSLPVCAGHSG